jgi:hypothetical protein
MRAAIRLLLSDLSRLRAKLPALPYVRSLFSRARFASRSSPPLVEAFLRYPIQRRNIPAGNLASIDTPLALLEANASEIEWLFRSG